MLNMNCRGCRQRFLPLPDFSGKIEGDSVRRLFMRKILCSILKVVYFDRWSGQSFVSTCDVFNCLFHWMYKMKYSCYQESSVIHGWFVYWVFGWEMRRLSKFGTPITDGSVFVFHLALCVREFKSLKQLWPFLIAFRNWISNGKPE